LTENQVIALHKALLTPGFHNMQVNSIEEGRAILYTMLNALSYYSDLACLSLSDSALPSSVYDLSYHLTQGGYIDKACRTDLENFFLERFDNDFLWIEATQELMKEPWYLYLEQKIVELRIDQQIPIMIISYF